MYYRMDNSSKKVRTWSIVIVTHVLPKCGVADREIIELLQLEIWNTDTILLAQISLDCAKTPLQKWSRIYPIQTSAPTIYGKTLKLERQTKPFGLSYPKMNNPHSLAQNDPCLHKMIQMSNSVMENHRRQDQQLDQFVIHTNTMNRTRRKEKIFILPSKTKILSYLWPEADSKLTPSTAAAINVFGKHKLDKKILMNNNGEHNYFVCWFYV